MSEYEKEQHASRHHDLEQLEKEDVKPSEADDADSHGNDADEAAPDS